MHDADRYETIFIQNGKKLAIKEKYISYVYAITNHQTLAFSFLKSFVSLDIHHGRMSQE